MRGLVPVVALVGLIAARTAPAGTCTGELVQTLLAARPAATTVALHFLDPRIAPEAAARALGAIERRLGDGRVATALVVAQSAAGADTLAGIPVLRVGPGCTDAPSFHVVDRSGAIVYTTRAGTGDFHVLAQVVARHVLRRGRLAFVEEVGLYFDGLLARGRVRPAGPSAAGLYLPPGCSACQLEKHAAAIAAYLAARPGAVIYAHDPDLDGELARRGWHRPLVVLPEDDGAVLLALWSGPAVVPVTLHFTGGQVVSARSVDHPEG